MTDYSKALPDELVLLREPASTSLAPRSWEVALLVLDEDGDVHLRKRTSHGADGVPMDEWKGRTMTWQLASSKFGACVLDIDRLRRELADGGYLSFLLDRVRAGHTVKWDGNNYVGRLTEDAVDASDDIENDDYAADVEVWDAEEWLQGEESPAATLRAIDLPTDATDEQIAAAASMLADDAKRDGVVIAGDMAEALRSIIDAARQDA